MARLNLDVCVQYVHHKGFLAFFKKTLVNKKLLFILIFLGTNEVPNTTGFLVISPANILTGLCFSCIIKWNGTYVMPKMLFERQSFKSFKILFLF